MSLTRHQLERQSTVDAVACCQQAAVHLQLTRNEQQPSRHHCCEHGIEGKRTWRTSESINVSCMRKNLEALVEKKRIRSKETKL